MKPTLNIHEIFNAMKRGDYFKFEQGFVGSVMEALRSHDQALLVHSSTLFRRLGKCADTWVNAYLALQFEDEPHKRISDDEYFEICGKYAHALTMVVKYLYPMVEQLDALVDDTLTIVPSE